MKPENSLNHSKWECKYHIGVSQIRRISMIPVIVNLCESPRRAGGLLTDVTHPNDISIKIVGYENT
jgi:hypothetical protein